MPDNFTYEDIMEQLIRYTDGELNAQENAATEQLLLNDKSLKERYVNLVLAKAAIRSQGLQQRVKALHNNYITEINAAESRPTDTAKIIKPPFLNGIKIIMRIAAVFIVVVAGYGVYQYSATSNETVFADNFISYRLPVSRGENTATPIDSFYQSSNYNAVLEAFNSTAEKTQKNYFLAALANLQMGNSKAAVDEFRSLQQINANAVQKYFVQETEYYLALAYIKSGNINEAEKLVNSIKQNKQHLFYKKANEISDLKWSLLKWKQ